MRTLGFRTHVLLAIAAAVGVLLTLSRPWYNGAPPPASEAPGIGDINGPLNAFFDGAQRWVTDADGETGWQALDHWGLAIGAMSGVAIVGALFCLAPMLQVLGRDMLRYGSLAAFGIVVWKVLDSPGDNAALELRNGAIAAAGFSLVLVTCAGAAASAPLRRRVSPQRFTAPPPPPAFGSSGPPQA